MNLLYDNLYTSYIHMKSTIFDFLEVALKLHVATTLELL
jgi:hypothetical protein